MAAAHCTTAAVHDSLRELSRAAVINIVIPDGSAADDPGKRVGNTTAFKRERLADYNFSPSSTTHVEIFDPTTPRVNHVQVTHDAYDMSGHPRRGFPGVPS